MVLGNYVCDILPTGGKPFIHIITNRIISMKIYPGTLLNVIVLRMALANYLITLIWRSISGTFSDAAVVFKFDLLGIMFLVFLNSLSMYNASTYIPCLK